MAERMNEGKTKRPYKRRHYFINKRLQGMFTLVFLIIGFIIVSGTNVITWHLSSATIDEFAYRSHVAPVGPWNVILPIVLKTLLVPVVVLAVSACAATRFAFRRITSRLQAFNAAMIKIGNGDLRSEVPDGGIDDLNGMLDVVRQRFREKAMVLKGLHREMAAVAENDQLTEGKRHELARLCNTLREDVPEVRAQ